VWSNGIAPNNHLTGLVELAVVDLRWDLGDPIISGKAQWVAGTGGAAKRRKWTGWNAFVQQAGRPRRPKLDV
jgi:hypothetical protein